VTPADDATVFVIDDDACMRAATVDRALVLQALEAAGCMTDYAAAKLGLKRTALI
jgi:transcriptional regulator with GAF, ATPase, and Fis domain